MNKYLKYKKKYFKLNQQFGGKLTKEQKKEYIDLLHKLYKLYEDDDSYYSDILKRLLEIAYNESEKVINSYKMVIPDIFVDKYNNIKTEIETIYTSCDYILDIPEFNIRLFQIVIIYTIIIKLTHPNREETSMLNYFQQPNYKIHEEYEDFLSVWDNYNELLEKVKKSNFHTLIHYYKGFDQYIDQPPQPDYTFKNITSGNIRLVCYLDYISEKEIIYSFINNFYYIGINEKLDYADGKLLTPFEFLHHDLTHADNRRNDGNREFEKKFYDILEQISYLLTSYQKKQIYIIFFIIIHESISESILQQKIQSSFTFSQLSPLFITNLDNWRNKHYYNLLLPIDIQNKSNEIIQKYLDDSFELFKNTWNIIQDIQ